MTVKIILLNGVGSAGKTSIAKALQAMTIEPFLHVQMDAFLEMLPEKLQNHRQGFFFETSWQDGKPSVAIKAGPVGRRAMQGMRHAIAAMARQGNNLIVDDVMLRDEMSEYLALLADFEIFRIAVLASLDVLEARESDRADRMPGLARWQYGRAHEGISYDLEIDTSMLTAQECALRIQQQFRL
ncbi:chloramphenicol phosphotransferase [Mesorhizobium sp. M1C.F.Ca.ET.193.01.1.1]|uniref:chloramphenicol phosphotransferase CPT family protein n=1 Tax=unclassified Mesorhizobium TaxID=325217 RepID=UPI000FD2242A|nr:MULTISPECIES: AAA family ATPase [unclassified Mesorhizobium]TGT04655.1 chloramphenicol phosphotransferase [bacterium M00.F.Ca.ET.177.01.1.1]TGQ57483.1 chloramphenicol phosphotransferase [Mesorhizobium sp. M1C.F.Ca.ET.210.01.1.1]TGQ75941.1 chloramphenicol phosphotransferase [Mesorhizobium sp. M1C.F.Ca.ET.212.01.1.1]TGR14324.1 chloramphenicol phosphotransferase [Mesorhizobium sp. M1C.F.Ca.ET.204.01.1.1]TGR35486.1 chloramphenicol phosphotransferase [Mesorhizobium sp. M1C.F.Ca.ET.196.01.1.1]